jgi:hypothetical protein
MQKSAHPSVFAVAIAVLLCLAAVVELRKSQSRRSRRRRRITPTRLYCRSPTPARRF